MADLNLLGLPWTSNGDGSASAGDSRTVGYRTYWIDARIRHAFPRGVQVPAQVIQDTPEYDPAFVERSTRGEAGFAGPGPSGSSSSSLGDVPANSLQRVRDFLNGLSKAQKVVATIGFLLGSAYVARRLAKR